MTARIVLVPGVLALLPEYAGLVDPVAELRAVCLDAVTWLGEGERAVTVVADEQGTRVAEALLAAAGVSTTGSRPGRCYLVVANGSAKRTEKAPGHLDQRAEEFDAALGKALRDTDTGALARIDHDLARGLWAGAAGFAALGELLTREHRATVDYDDDPFGVQYWVMRWSCES